MLISFDSFLQFIQAGKEDMTAAMSLVVDFINEDFSS